MSRLNALQHLHLNTYQPGHLPGASTMPHLGAGFPLICFQRLSDPDIAALRCRWHDSRQTRGLFNSVLSYQSQFPSSINACSRQETNLSHACYHELLRAMDYSFVLVTRNQFTSSPAQSMFSLYGRFKCKITLLTSLGILHQLVESTDINRLHHLETSY